MYLYRKGVSPRKVDRRRLSKKIDEKRQLVIKASVYGQPAATVIFDLFDLFDSVVTANRDAASICHFNPSFSIYLQLSLPHDFRVAITPRQVEFFKVPTTD